MVHSDKPWLAMVHSDKPWLAMIHSDKPWPMMCDDVILFWEHRQPLIVSVYYCFILHPSALKRCSCYHMSQEKEDIVSQVIRTTPIYHKSWSNHATVKLTTLDV